MIRTRNRRPVLAGVAGLLLAVGLAHPASADDVETFYNRVVDGCLDSYSSGYAYTVQCDANDQGQNWRVHVWNDGTRQLQSAATNMCLAEVDNGNGTGDVYTAGCTSGQDQSWYVYQYSDGSVRFQNQASHLCLDASNTYSLREFTCGDPSAQSQYQTWY